MLLHYYRSKIIEVIKDPNKLYVRGSKLSFLACTISLTNLISINNIFKMIFCYIVVGRSQRAIWDSIDLAVDKQMFDLNVFSVVNLSRVALDHFNKRGEGHIAVVSSLAGVIGVPFSGTYTGSKHAIHVSCRFNFK